MIMMILAPVSWYFDNLTHYVPQLIIASAVCLVLLIWQRRIVLIVPLVLAVLYFSWQMVPLYLPVDSRLDDSKNINFTEVTILHANVNYVNDNYNKLLNLIDDREPDIITLNESNDKWLAAINNGFGERYPYKIELPSENYQGVAILSKLPIKNEAIYYFSDEDSPLIKAQLVDHNITLYLIHTLSPINARWKGLRDQLIQALGVMAADTDGSIIAVGDFNSTVHQSTFRRFLRRSKLIDGRLGFGWKPSWMYGTPLAVAIDHLLYRGDNIEITDFQVGPKIGSDHRPIVVDLQLAISD
jgi:endonuclease/exonuclease/phosphatase (EEP) superfamily protein YafD